MGWEYLIVSIASTEGGGTTQVPLPSGLAALNAVGAHGWELVSITERVNFCLCFFKRPLRSDS